MPARRAAIREWVCTSGTAGKPLAVPLTQRDLQRLAANEAAALSIAGIGPGCNVLLAVALDRQFVAGLAYWMGIQELGAAAVRAGPQVAGHPDVLRQMIADYAVSHIIAVPSLLAATDTIDGIKGVISIGEPIRAATLELNNLGNILAGRFKAPIMSTYASTETCASFAEGPQCQGGHLNPQLALVEILDDHGATLPAGQAGQVVVTPLGVEGMPLVRFATGDIAALYGEPCPCGRTTPRLGPILGRKHQLLKVQGTSLFPNAIFEALAVDAQEYVVVVEQGHALSDRIVLHIALRADAPAARLSLESRLRGLLRVQPEMVYADASAIRQLQHSTASRKPQRFIDRRKP